MRFDKIKYSSAKGEVLLIWSTEAKPGTDKAERHEHTLTSKDEPHEDFVDALADLTSDVLHVCELPQRYEEGLRVQSVTFSFNEKTGVRGAVVTALKTLERAPSPLVLNTPHLLDEGDEGVMPIGMSIHLEQLELEAARYIEGKRAQGDMFADAKTSTLKERSNQALDKALGAALEGSGLADRVTVTTG